jgi:hypothetical protein
VGKTGDARTRECNELAFNFANGSANADPRYARNSFAINRTVNGGRERGRIRFSSPALKLTARPA